MNEVKRCTCPISAWIGSEPNDSTCELSEEEHHRIEATRAEAERPKVELPSLSGPWSGRWCGSLPQRGWSIVKDRDVVAYLGPDAPSEAVTAIVYAHNIEIAELKARLQK